MVLFALPKGTNHDVQDRSPETPQRQGGRRSSQPTAGHEIPVAMPTSGDSPDEAASSVPGNAQLVTEE
jgi:hypothetical protein